METLAQWIHRRGPLAPKDAVGWAIRLAKHLEALHLHGVAHGNVSPACVLIEHTDPRARGVVADVRRTAEMVQYHSPERFRNGQLSPSDDAWGLAATLFTALTSARPFGDLRPEVEQRHPHGLPPLAAYGVNDDTLYAILANALVLDPSRRTSNVATLRMQLEHWFADPRVRELTALDDEEGAEEDAAATAMVPMDRNLFEEPSTSKGPESLGNVFAPPSFDRASQPQPSSGQRMSSPMTVPRGAPPPPRSQPGPGAPPPAPSAPGARNVPQAVSASPLGEQDQTVMRELPAHIMAMAARAAQGSNPPPPPDAKDDAADDSDFGGTTKIAPAPDLAAMLLSGGAPPAAPPPRAPPPPMAPPPPPMAPPPPPLAPPPAPSGPGRQIPRAFKSTQLGMGTSGPPMGAPPMGAPPMAAPPQQNPMAPAPPGAQPGPMAPRPGFMPPPASISTNPPPRGAAGIPIADVNFPSSPPPDDDDDGGRTVMRESPGVSEIFRAPQPAAGQPAAPQAQWKPAPPPVQPRAFGATDRPTAMAAAPPGGGAVSALIAETLEAAPQPAPPPLAHETTGLGLGGQGGPPQAAGPFQPLGGASAGGFNNPAPWMQQGQEVSGSFAFQPPGAQTVAFPPGAPGGPPMHGPSGGVPPIAEAQPLAPFGPPDGGASAHQQQQQQGAQGYPLGASLGAEAAPAPRRKRSKAGLIVICFLVLILAAAVTFSVLRFRPQLGF
ncbi:MAG: hypothetical protein IPG04_37050 [Polyangiaceae bacterium]|nr:hypothetical protein [Polyangiaceae bacterium]